MFLLVVPCKHAVNLLSPLQGQSIFMLLNISASGEIMVEEND